MVAIHKQEIIVSAAESEQKIFQFLLRRLNLPKPLIHRWIRKGKLRCNGLRIKPFARIIEGDVIIVPYYIPNTLDSQNTENDKQIPLISEPKIHYGIKYRHRNIDNEELCEATQALLQEVQIIYEDKNLIVCNKPAGLPTHLGSKHKTSLITHIHNLYENNIFKPTPVHRLDKDTSGLLLIALSYKTLRTLQDAFKAQEVDKEYFAWVEGQWKEPQTIELKHKLEKIYNQTYEKVQTGTGKDSICLVRPLSVDKEKSLLQIRLITGKTHQIRVQLAKQGFPLYGDMKYGSKIKVDFKLHAFRLIVPNFQHFELLPNWVQDWTVKALPKPLILK